MPKLRHAPAGALLGAGVEVKLQLRMREDDRALVATLGDEVPALPADLLLLAGKDGVETLRNAGAATKLS